MSAIPLSYPQTSAFTTQVHPSWFPLIDDALNTIDPAYLADLAAREDWLPGAAALLNAFTLPKDQVKVVLFGESPYPRAASANGYAFWDAAVQDLWSASGLDKKVNRATSLRNFIKMLLIADGRLNKENTSQPAIAALDKSEFVQTGAGLFQRCLEKGFLLLNASLVLQDQPPKKDAKHFAPFLTVLMRELLKNRPDITLLLFGQIAKDLAPLLPTSHTNRIITEHPYNLSFIQHPDIIAFFKPLRLLAAHD